MFWLPRILEDMTLEVGKESCGLVREEEFPAPGKPFHSQGLWPLFHILPMLRTIYEYFGTFFFS